MASTHPTTIGKEGNERGRKGREAAIGRKEGERGGGREE